MQATSCSKTDVNPSSASWNMAAFGSGRTAFRSRGIATRRSNGFLAVRGVPFMSSY
jgi:hypothetical protein